MRIDPKNNMAHTGPQRTASRRRAAWTLAAITLILCPSTILAAGLELKPNDHVVIIGNTLADRMQHDGWLETLIQSRLPEHDLTFRNLAFPGDEVANRPREENFGSPDQWLTRTGATVVFAFFGYNEAFRGEAGLDKFRKDLAQWIDHTRGQKYSRTGQPPRIVLFAPIAHEDLKSRLLPDGREHNVLLAMYAKAMGEVAAAKSVPFVDLFAATQRLYEKHDQPLTINGVHLNESGNRAIAEVIVQSLLPGVDAKRDDEALLQRIRQAVIDKNFHWFNLYRTVDGYNVYGGRSTLNWHGQSNADVMQREMDIFEVMTANRQKRVWAVAKGGDMKVDDSNAPPLLPVKTNRPGPLPDGSYPFLSGEEAISKMQVAKGMKVNLFASEERFPDLINPVQMAVDTDSRLWVATWPSYPHWNPAEPLSDKIVILPDEDRDGVADRMIVFADGLNSVTGFEFWGGGVIVAAAPELWFLKDTDGDDRADLRIRIMQGVSSADSHHTANSLVIGPDGGLYYSRGIFHLENVETPTKTFRSAASGVYRFDPRTYEIDFHFPVGPNPHGDVFDQWGYQFATDGTGGTGYYVSIGKGVNAPKEWYTKRVRPVAATGILSSSHFPPANQGNFLICNVIGFLGVLQHEVKYNGADITAHEIEPIVVSSDPNFRPSDLEVGGDGALYVADWHNPLIGHMQHNIRDPNRDDKHGRIYRVTAVGRSLLEPAKMKGKPVEQVAEFFHAKENGTRYRARLELSGRDTAEVTAAMTSWAAKLNIADPAHEQPLLEALWVFQEHRVPNGALLATVFRAKEPRVRAAAIRTLRDWGTKVEAWRDLLAAASRDESALVRAEAVVAAAEFEGLPAAEVIFEVATRPTDPQLDYVLNYARSRINVDQMVQDALRNNQPMSPAAQTYAVSKASVETLLSMKRSDAVNEALLSRGGVPIEARREALAAMAAKNNTTPLRELIDAVARADQRTYESVNDLLNELFVATATDLAGVEPRIADLAAGANSSPVRQAAYTVWLNIDGAAPRAWTHASASSDRLADMLRTLPQSKSRAATASLYENVRPIMFDLPANLKGDPSAASTASAGQMRVDFHAPARQTAQLSVYEKLTPATTAHAKTFSIDDADLKTRDNFALVFTGTISIPRNGDYTFFTHSDDGSRLYINGREVIDNDGLHGMVEKSDKVSLKAGVHDIVVVYFDNGGGDGLTVSWAGPGIRKQPIPASVLGGRSEGNLHDLAIAAVARIDGPAEQKVDDFARLITEGRNVPAALHALASMHPGVVTRQLSPEKIAAVGQAMTDYADQVPLARRELPAFGVLISMGESLAAAIPADSTLRQKVADLRASIPTKVDPKIMSLGREVYFREGHCGTCHQADGRGLPGQYPPIDGTTWISGSEQRLIRMTLHGLMGKITIEGQTYESPPLPPMTPFKDLLNDEELAAVLTYVRNSWSNRAKPIDPGTVKQVRQAVADRVLFWTPEELLKLYPLEEAE